MPPRRPRDPFPDLERLIAAGYRRRVLGKFRENPGHPYEDGMERRFSGALAVRWKALTGGRDDVTMVRLFPLPDSDFIRWAAEDAESHSPGYRAPDFLTCFAIDCPPGVDAQRLARGLAEWPEVELAYVQGLPSLPPGFPVVADYSPEPYFPYERHLSDAPEGIGVRRAWAYPGGDGSGVRFVDVEQGWRLAHEDLPQQPRIPLLPAGVSLSHDFHEHGTEVLGVVLAVPNGRGAVGIAPGVRAQVVSEWWKRPGLTWPPPPITHCPARAIFYAACLLGRGDVMLLESQSYTEEEGVTSPRPLEIEPLNFMAIRFATARGIVVVEPAGNGADDTGLGNLDASEFARKFDRSERDSRAILVAAAEWFPPSAGVTGYFKRRDNSNHGTRVDCFAWGADVVTLGEPDGPGEMTEDGVRLAQGYVTSFNRTSSASAIIAGVCAVVQGISCWRRGGPLPVEKLRSILSDPGYGTQAFTAEPGAAGTAVDPTVGVMPDLGRILQYFGLD